MDLIPSESPTASFLSLPGEVRNTIYRLAFVRLRLIIFSHEGNEVECIFSNRSRALLLANKKIRREAANYVYSDLRIDTQWSLLPDTLCLQDASHEEHILKAFQSAKDIYLTNYLEPKLYDPGSFRHCYELQCLFLQVAMCKVFCVNAATRAFENQRRREADEIIEGYLNDCRVRLERDYDLNRRIQRSERIWTDEFKESKPSATQNVRRSCQRLDIAPLGPGDSKGVNNKGPSGTFLSSPSDLTTEARFHQSWFS